MADTKPVSAANVAVGKPNIKVSGGVLAAPTGTERPEGFESSFDPDYKSLGYVSEDGVTETSERNTEEIRAWGGMKVRTVQTEFGTTLAFTLIESRRAETLKYVFGEGNVTEESGQIMVMRNEAPLPHMQLLVDMIDGDDSRLLDAGNSQVVSVGDISYVDGEAISYELEVSCDPDDDGNTLIEYIKTSGSSSGD